MRCSVPGCKNDSRYISKSQGITFHIFPYESTLRTAWLQAVGKQHWEPKERSAVCSEHFLCEDLYETKSGLRKVRAGAVPIIVQDSSNGDYGKTSGLKVCRICLEMTTKLFPMKKYKLVQAYQYVTGLTICEEDRLPRKLCGECAHRLLSCHSFRNKSLRANKLMVELLNKHDNLTVDNLKTIDRLNNQLISKLEIKHYTPDYTDLHIEDKEEIKEIKEEEEVNIQDEVVKNEINSEIFVDEFVEENKINDTIDDFDADYIQTEKEYSTDDSLPLERRREKKKKKKVVKSVRKKQVKDPTQPKIDRRRKPFLNDDFNETLFTITNLSFEEQVAEILKRQDSANYKNSVFKCIECYKGFLDKEAYNSHMSRHTNQCGDYQCDICKTHFKHPHALRKHITAHHTQRFSCNRCPYVTTHRQTARLHERWHKGTKYQCPHCPDEFQKFTTYMGHIRIKHPSDFVCQLCGYSFVSEKGIQLHKKLKHRLDNEQIPEDGPYCEQCNVRFVSAEALKRHIVVSARHADEDKEANKPKRGRKTRDVLEKERTAKEKVDDDKKVYPSQMRKAEGPIPCEQCGLQLEDSRAYHGHFRRMHPDKNRTKYPSMKSPCMCEVCGRMFQSYALLKDHRWTHTGERPFACESCGKSFRMKQRLVAHRRVHSQHKASYGCSLCGKHFSTHSNRQRHMFIHTGLKPFKCEMCGKGFKHASEKRAHITYVHLKKPWPKRTRGKRRPDARTGQMPPQPSVPTSASEMDIAQPLWPTCDPKLGEINPMMEDKPMYYNLKI
ncbi:zinc finger protein 737-like [Achroia grisella]|uniref:zinc finger protein 737-like n=1 Tax=Achroia grisella TaxID=688607 RepID=UPI0027D3327E|nr:zinc finger protein 737-like [Achroia grisella]